ncbi:hypothetical protein [Streptomyces sp. NBC_00826]|uniref:hypothetical protein n=1 Tax=Streptomyces sp. NBC_00826 TaxID=2975845 RepID=UPI00386FC016|nr:hypothetical protein OG832_47955 [Streptomyces sp. NBC_00826]
MARARGARSPHPCAEARPPTTAPTTSWICARSRPSIDNGFHDAIRAAGSFTLRSISCTRSTTAGCVRYGSNRWTAAPCGSRNHTPNPAYASVSAWSRASSDFPKPDRPRLAPNSTSCCGTAASRARPSAPVTMPSGTTPCCPVHSGSRDGAAGTTPPVRTTFVGVQCTDGGLSSAAISREVTHCRFEGANSPVSKRRAKLRRRHQTLLYGRHIPVRGPTGRHQFSPDQASITAIT